MGSGVGGMIDILFVVSGIYLIWMARRAKTRGNVAGGIMLGKDMNENDIMDKTGFIDYMYRKILFSGIMIVAAGILHMVNDCYIYSSALTWIGIAMILVAMGIYTAAFLQAKKRYFRVQKKESHKK